MQSILATDLRGSRVQGSLHERSDDLYHPPTCGGINFAQFCSSAAADRLLQQHHAISGGGGVQQSRLKTGRTASLTANRAGSEDYRKRDDQSAKQALSDARHLVAS
jgi:hypothetical protein